ncbi:hypothetical protein Tco_1078631 [Tanacetum coccineum]|uniref:Uncharacterized protein n=1 Tax=Tanacetum coccineum TaxID=301880 RepID=A0ABQ5HQQ3_9ASTR
MHDMAASGVRPTFESSYDKTSPSIMKADGVLRLVTSYAQGPPWKGVVRLRLELLQGFEQIGGDETDSVDGQSTILRVHRQTFDRLTTKKYTYRGKRADVRDRLAPWTTKSKAKADELVVDLYLGTLHLKMIPDGDRALFALEAAARTTQGGVVDGHWGVYGVGGGVFGDVSLSLSQRISQCRIDERKLASVCMCGVGEGRGYFDCLREMRNGDCRVQNKRGTD